MKIHIIGCSGSGKSFLAKRLGAHYGLTVYDLDDIHLVNDGYGVKRPPEDRDALLREILQRDAWIIEGSYHKWVGQCFADADIIYLLDMPALLCKIRILRRFFKRKLGIEPGKGETLRSVSDLLAWVAKYHSVKMPQIEDMLLPYADKTVRLTSRRDVRRLLCTSGKK